MRYSQLLAPTLKENPADAEIESHRLMLRAGMIRKEAAGLYAYLPLGQRVLSNVSRIVREEMDRAGGQELFMPSLIPAELWQESGRWNLYGKELLRITDRAGREFCYGPTHEEVITEIVRGSVKSYRQLPLLLYQIQTKFRDEIRPRFGLMRGREFQMKDAYSFHATQESLDEMYQRMHDAYCKIFDRCGLAYKAVEADTGSIGGSSSHEFMVLADTGEAEILFCPHCSFTANVEAAVGHHAFLDGLVEPDRASVPAIVEIHTPNVGSIEDVEAFLKIPSTQFIKSLVYQGSSETVLVLLRGDFNINDVALRKLLGDSSFVLAEEETVQQLTGAKVGFAGPVGLKQKVRIIADRTIKSIKYGVTGANRTDYHIKAVALGRDFNVDVWGDISQISKGDVCGKCGKPGIESTRGIEVGHIFKLGTKYSKAMSATFLNAEGQEAPYIMGCYGIGIGRTAAAAIEQHHDANGIIWPSALAPFQIIVTVANMSEEPQRLAGEALYKQLLETGKTVLFDDRDERAGVKFKDADLIGIPYRVTVGKSLAEGTVEIKKRGEKDFAAVPVTGILEFFKDKI